MSHSLKSSQKWLTLYAMRWLEYLSTDPNDIVDLSLKDGKNANYPLQTFTHQLDMKEYFDRCYRLTCESVGAIFIPDWETALNYPEFNFESDEMIEKEINRLFLKGHDAFFYYLDFAENGLFEGTLVLSPNAMEQFYLFYVQNYVDPADKQQHLDYLYTHFAQLYYSDNGIKYRSSLEHVFKKKQSNVDRKNLFAEILTLLLSIPFKPAEEIMYHSRVLNESMFDSLIVPATLDIQDKMLLNINNLEWLEAYYQSYSKHRFNIIVPSLECIVTHLLSCPNLREIVHRIASIIPKKKVNQQQFSILLNRLEQQYSLGSRIGYTNRPKKRTGKICYGCGTKTNISCKFCRTGMCEYCISRKIRCKCHQKRY